MASITTPLFEQWEQEFAPYLRDVPHHERWEGFSYIVRDQLERDKPVIVETGTLRTPPDNPMAWQNDGQSTRIWDWIVRHKKDAWACSVDSYRCACDLARFYCKAVDVHWDDSISSLRGIARNTTLLYLDSYDYTEGRELDACWHQVAELGAAWERLPSGCLIASDDNGGRGAGKGAFVRLIMEALKIEPVVDSYIMVWRKP